MRLISWNVNGIRACAKKGFEDFFAQTDADVFAIQETKCQPGQYVWEPEGYTQFWNSAERKGYSGVAVFAKKEPLGVRYGMGIPAHDTEGRIITLEYEKFFFVTCYTPNSKNELLRLDYRMEWEDAFRDFLMRLDAEKPVIFCGDLNVAHEEIDLKNPDTNHRNAGFTDEERGKFSALLAAGFCDSFRLLHPTLEGAYSWWSYRMRARERNAGWRIDYFCVSDRIKDNIKAAIIHQDIFGSDHCPVELEIDL